MTIWSELAGLFQAKVIYEIQKSLPWTRKLTDGEPFNTLSFQKDSVTWYARLRCQGPLGLPSCRFMSFAGTNHSAFMTSIHCPRLMTELSKPH